MGARMLLVSLRSHGTSKIWYIIGVSSPGVIQSLFFQPSNLVYVVAQVGGGANEDYFSNW